MRYLFVRSSVRAQLNYCSSPAVVSSAAPVVDVDVLVLYDVVVDVVYWPAVMDTA